MKNPNHLNILILALCTLNACQPASFISANPSPSTLKPSAKPSVQQSIAPPTKPSSPSLSVNTNSNSIPVILKAVSNLSINETLYPNKIVPVNHFKSTYNLLYKDQNGKIKGQIFGLGAEYPQKSKSLSTQQFQIQTYSNGVYSVADDQNLPAESMELYQSFQQIPVYNQGVRGTCTFFAWTSLLDFMNHSIGLEGSTSQQFLSWYYQEFYRNYADSDEDNDGNYSEGSFISLVAELIDANSPPDPYPRDYRNHLNDDGSTIQDLNSVINNVGVPLNDFAPYSNEQIPLTRFGTRLSDLGLVERARLFFGQNALDQLGSSPIPVRKALTYFVHQDINTLKCLLANQHPVIVGIPVWEANEEDLRENILHFSLFQDFETLDETVISMPPDRDRNGEPDRAGGGHAVLLVGYRDDADAPGGGYFILRNSWSSEWGFNGYALIPYEYILNYGHSTMAADPLLPQDQQQTTFFDLNASGGSATITISHVKEGPSND